MPATKKKSVTLPTGFQLDHMGDHWKHYGAGNHPTKIEDGKPRKVFHTDSKGLWWCGWQLHNLTSQQLVDLARSIEADVLRADPSVK